MYRLARTSSADSLSSFKLPPQLVDPSLRGGSPEFPNLRVGRFGSEALADDLTPYHVAKLLRPDIINLNQPKPIDPKLNKVSEEGRFDREVKRIAKATENVQFQKAGQSPGQAKALGELIRKNPALADSFDTGYGSSLNRAQVEAQKGRTAFDFDPTDGDMRRGFTRQNPNIVRMSDLQDALLTIPRGTALASYDGSPLDPALTKLYYNIADSSKDINDPQRFFNLKERSQVDSTGIANALNTLSLDKTKANKKDFSLAKRWERVQKYAPFPPRGVNSVVNPDKPTQSIDQIVDDVSQVEPWGTPRMADSRAVLSQNTGNSDLNIIPKRGEFEDWERSMGDSISLEPDKYSGQRRVAELFGGSYVDSKGLPVSQKDIGDAVIEDRTFLLDHPSEQRPTTRLDREAMGADYFNPYREGYARGETNVSDNLFVKNFSQPNGIAPARLAWDEGGLPLNSTLQAKEQYLRVPEQQYALGNRSGLPIRRGSDGEGKPFRPFYSPEVILPASLTNRVQQYSGNAGITPNNYRIADSKAARGGYKEFNEVMDEGINTSQNLDRLYGLNDELAELGELARKDDMYADILGYEQSNVMDKIVEAERTAQNMGGTYRRLTGAGEQGVTEALGINYEPAPIPMRMASPEIEPFNQAQYTRDMIDRGGVLIDTQLGIPIVKAPTTYYDAVQGKNISYAQSVRPSRASLTLPWGNTSDSIANWQAPEAMEVGRIGRGVPIGNIPSLPVSTMEEVASSVGRQADFPMATMRRALMNDNTVNLTPMPGRQARGAFPEGDFRLLYPNAGIGPINTGLKPKPTIGEAFGFTALTSQGLAQYRDM